jgi:hypothetical protein
MMINLMPNLKQLDMEIFTWRGLEMDQLSQEDMQGAFSPPFFFRDALRDNLQLRLIVDRQLYPNSHGCYGQTNINIKVVEAFLVAEEF